MRLRDLEAFLVRHEVRIETWRRVRAEVFAVKQAGPWLEGDFEDFTGGREYIVDSLAEAQGLWFQCPLSSRLEKVRGKLH